MIDSGEMDDDDLLIDFVDDDDEVSALREAFEEIEARCKAAKIEYKYEQWEDEEPDLIVFMPSGREVVRVGLYSLETAQQFLSVEFEKFRYLENYEGLVCHDQQIVEVAISSPGSRLSSSAYRVFEKLLSSTEEIDASQIDDGHIVLIEPSNGELKVSLGPASEQFLALSRYRGRKKLSIKFYGKLPEGSDRINDLVERVSNSIFFQLDLQTGFAFSLTRQIKRRGIRFSRTAPAILNYPKFEYDKAPMELYWYARGAQGLPLLQFLAFYQVVEYFFPLHSRAEAQKRIRNVLKDPAFRADRETDIGRIIACIRENRGAGFFDERTQLRATINEVTNSDEINEILNREDIFDFYSNDFKKVVSTKVPVAKKNSDLRNDVADRLYDIRCKIVHTKADGKDGEVELLLPNSREEQHLGADIELMACIARACLISSGAPMR